MGWKASAIAKELTVGPKGDALSISDKLVLMILCENYIEKQGCVWCSQAELASWCLCTERGLRKILYRLQEFGMVGIVSRGRRGNYYSLPFLRNDVPVSLETLPEPKDRLPERIPEPQDHLPEPAGNVSILNGSTVKTVDGAPHNQEWKDYQERLRIEAARINGKAARKGKFPAKAHPQKEIVHVQEVRTRSKGEERAERTRKAIEILDHPERIPEHLRPIVPTRNHR